MGGACGFAPLTWILLAYLLLGGFTYLLGCRAYLLTYYLLTWLLTCNYFTYVERCNRSCSDVQSKKRPVAPIQSIYHLQYVASPQSSV